jgi:hypothetical protein
MADLIDLAAIRRAVAAAKAARAVLADEPDRRPSDPMHSVAQWELCRSAVNVAHRLAALTAEQARDVVAILASDPDYLAELLDVVRTTLEHIAAADEALRIAVERLAVASPRR